MNTVSFQSEDEVFEAILAIEGDEALFLRVDENFCMDLKYMEFKLSGLQNTVMSYINATHELANVVNFEKFVDRIASITVEEKLLREKIVATYAGEKALMYLKTPHSNHKFVVDNYNYMLIIQRKDSCTPHGHMGLCAH